MKKLLVLSPLVVLVCFGLAARLPNETLFAWPLFGYALLTLGLLAFVVGCAAGVAFAVRNKRPRWYALPVGCLAAGALSLLLLGMPTVEAGTTEAKTGTVIDAATQKPIAGAYVIVRWTHHRAPRAPIGHAGRGLAGGGTYATLVQTDAAGRFEIPAPGNAFPVGRAPSLEATDDYRWDLSIYAPGYSPPKFPEALDGHTSHPAVQRAAGGRQELEPIAMTPVQPGDAAHRAYYLTTVVPNDFTCWGQCGPLAFAAVLYREAYPLTCEAGGLAEARPLADLRSGKFGTLALPAETAQALTEITKAYRFNDPLPDQDARRICELLKHADEAHP